MCRSNLLAPRPLWPDATHASSGLRPTAWNARARYSTWRSVGTNSDAFASTAKAIEGVPLADQRSGRPVKAPVIKKAEVKNVTAEKNPYAALLGLKKEQ